MNRSLDRANPDILIVMIAVKQIMRGGEEDKRREGMGPQKPATEMSDMAGRNSIVMEGIGSQITPNSIVQFDSFDLNNQNQIFDGYTVLHTSRGAPISDLHTDNRAVIVDSEALVTSLESNVRRGAEFQEQFWVEVPFLVQHLYPQEVVFKKI
ncbi:hypothetical protein GH714_030407 [Hevea brasiliensis]|uniref:Uncharacterized protein n=1 Tax=Hevea brasiliensis TaxID=3981 RepID=A0A6A6LTK0_HEVBR|nr:hypothetical protein GH714_030407 [Hevea brasiliensis]